MSIEPVEETATLPQTRQRSPYVYAIVYKGEDDGYSYQEVTSRQEALEFVNAVGAENVQRVYKVSETLQLKTKITF